MAATVYALLVGIDAYLPPVRALRGCVADIEAMRTFLGARIPGDGRRLELETLLDAEATRERIAERFRAHLGRAGEGDTALFCFCGHGSQAPTAPQFRHLEQDGLDETLVCHDSRRDGAFDLADKELSVLIAEVATNKPHVVVILDSCHSGSATRAVADAAVRRIATDTRSRPVESYLASPDEFARHIGARSSTASGEIDSASSAAPAWARLPPGQHVVLSACQADEEAKELPINGETRGVFSHHLLAALQGADESSTYRQLFVQIGARVRASVARQSPRIEANDPLDLDRPFLGGAVSASPATRYVYHEGEKGWFMDAGSVHGIAMPQGEETTFLSLFPASVDPFSTGAQSVGTARVREVSPGRSRLRLSLRGAAVPDTSAGYRGVVTSVPIPPRGVRLEGEPTALARVRERLARSGGNDAPALLVRELDSAESLVLIADEAGFRIRRAGDERPLSARVEGTDEAAANKAVEALEHIARWSNLLELSNPASALAADAVELVPWLVAADGSRQRFDPSAQGADLRLDYRFEHGEWHPPQFILEVVNNSDRRLYCALLDLTERFRISAKGLFPGGTATLEPGESVWARQGQPVPVTVPDELWREGLTEYRDVLKLIASTEPFDATGFEQGDLGGVAWSADSARSAGVPSTLEKLMRRGMSRDIPDLPDGGDRLVDWQSSELVITTLRPLEGRLLPARAADSVSLGPGVAVSGHGSFRATARLATEPLASRDLLGAAQMPPWLRDDPDIVQPLDLSPSRGVEAGLSVLELFDVRDVAAVTPEAPLKLKLDATLAPDEHVLAIAYDESTGLYLPVGRDRRGEDGLVIDIERLPEPAISTRSLVGSIKIFFKKIVAKAFGGDFEYPLLAAVDAGGARTTELADVKSRVADASSILLYVHGIIGDSEAMACGAFARVPGQTTRPLGQRYDLVLTFDYENLNTPIEQNAQLLGKRLEAVGLLAGHGRRFDVVAHSMGGLVARRFVEREGGAGVVSRLVMLGTPNLGTPWSTVENWVAGAIGIGLNRLSAVAWPVRALSALMGSFERAAGHTLEQMNIGSAFLDDLSRSDDPGVPYSIIAGNTGLIERALEPTSKAPQGLIARLLERLDLKEVLHRTSSLAFFGKPNDVAVSVEAIGGVPAFTSLGAVVTVACDHMSYFNVDESLRALDVALGHEQSLDTRLEPEHDTAPAGDGTQPA